MCSLVCLRCLPKGIPIPLALINNSHCLRLILCTDGFLLALRSLLYSITFCSKRMKAQQWRTDAKLSYHPVIPYTLYITQLYLDNLQGVINFRYTINLIYHPALPRKPQSVTHSRYKITPYILPNLKPAQFPLYTPYNITQLYLDNLPL